MKWRGDNTSLAIDISRLESVEINPTARGWFRNFVLRDPDSQSIICGDCVQVKSGMKVVQKVSMWKDINQRKPITTHLRLEHLQYLTLLLCI